MSFRIKDIWAWCSVDGDDEEGIVAFFVDGAWIPMIGADEARIRSLEAPATQVANTTGRAVHLRRFAAGTVEYTIEPKGARE